MSQFTEHAGRLKADLIDTDGLRVGPLGTDATKAWQTWTPTVSNTGSALGAGTVINARYQIIGRTCQFSITFDQTAAGTIGTGTYQITLPPGVRQRDISLELQLGPATLFAGSAFHMGSVVRGNNSDTLAIRAMSATVAPTLWGASLGGLDGTIVIAMCSGTFEMA